MSTDVQRKLLEKGKRVIHILMRHVTFVLHTMNHFCAQVDQDTPKV